MNFSVVKTAVNVDDTRIASRKKLSGEYCRRVYFSLSLVAKKSEKLKNAATGAKTGGVCKEPPSRKTKQLLRPQLRPGTPPDEKKNDTFS